MTGRGEIIDGKAFVDGIPIDLIKFTFTDVLPPGANAVVFKGSDKLLERNVVMKVWVTKPNDNRNKLGQARSESGKIAKLQHPNIASVYEADIDRHNRFFLIMEFIEGITLKNYLTTKKSFLERYKIWDIIFETMKFIHSKDIYHGDLHSNNIMIVADNPKVKIIDFGTSIFSCGRELHMRESRLLSSLVREMFPEYSLDDYTDIVFGEIPPSICNMACNAWTEILYILNELQRPNIDDYGIRSSIHTLHIKLFEHPLFDIKKILMRLNETKVNERYQKFLLDQLITGVQARIEGLETWATTDDPTETMDNKLTKLAPLMAKLQTIHLSNKKGGQAITGTT